MGVIHLTIRLVIHLVISLTRAVAIIQTIFKVEP